MDVLSWVALSFVLSVATLLFACRPLSVCLLYTKQRSRPVFLEKTQVLLEKKRRFTTDMYAVWRMTTIDDDDDDGPRY